MNVSLATMICNSLFVFVLLAGFASTDAFVPTRLTTSMVQKSLSKPLGAATMEPTTTDEPTTWECDDDLTECREVPACDEEQCRTSLDVRIHGEWYDLTG